MATQTVIITGGATGLGYAIAEGFLNTGANVTMNGRTLSKLETAAQKLHQPDRIHFVAGDITDPTFAPKLIAEAVSKFGRVDVLINNAGIFAVKHFTDYTIDKLDQYLGYVRGTFALTQETVKQMRVQGMAEPLSTSVQFLHSMGSKRSPLRHRSWQRRRLQQWLKTYRLS